MERGTRVLERVVGFFGLTPQINSENINMREAGTCKKVETEGEKEKETALFTKTHKTKYIYIYAIGCIPCKKKRRSTLHK